MHNSTNSIFLLGYVTFLHLSHFEKSKLTLQAPSLILLAIPAETQMANDPNVQNCSKAICHNFMFLLSPFSLWNSRLRHLAYLFSAFLNCFLGGLGSTIPKPLFLSLFPSILENLQKLEYHCLITGVYLLKTSHIPSAINSQHLTVKCSMLRGTTEVQMLSTASAGSAASRPEQFPNMQP